MDPFENYLSQDQYELVKNLNSPLEVQAFLDQIPYSTEYINRTPVQVIEDRMAHCLDGAIFAAAALYRLGHPPLLIDMFPDPGQDDDHVLAIYKYHGFFGAIAKSNFPGLRMREPIHRSLRELVITYFETFFNVKGVKTLRSYTRPLDLRQFDQFDWIHLPSTIQIIESRLLSKPRIPLITQEMTNQLSPVDPLSYNAGTVGVNPEGLYKPLDVIAES
jgi:hypothetical protein